MSLKVFFEKHYVLFYEIHPLDLYMLEQCKYTIIEQFNIYIHNHNITRQHPFRRCSGCVRAFRVRKDFAYRMQYSCTGQFSASNTAIVDNLNANPEYPQHQNLSSHIVCSCMCHRGELCDYFA